MELAYDRLFDLYMSISESRSEFNATYACRIERALKQQAKFKYMDHLESADSVSSILFAADSYVEAESGKKFDIYCNSTY